MIEYTKYLLESPMQLLIPSDWQSLLATYIASNAHSELIKSIDNAYDTTEVFPLREQIFQALALTPVSAVRVVILGQDPYHSKNQAHGLAFSVLPGTPIPPSLKNIYSEVVSDIGHLVHQTGNLTAWAQQGVLLLNTALTVESGTPGSHHAFGWETFTDTVIKNIAAEKEHVVFLLWGKQAIAKRALIDEQKHSVLTAPHPSPLSSYRGFFGCRHFSRTNNLLIQKGQRPIIW